MLWLDGFGRIFVTVLTVQYLLLSRIFLKLKLLVRDSKRQAKQAIESAFRLTQRGSVGIIGPASSGPAMSASTTLAIPSLDRAMISYSATSADLSGPSFSNFLRTAPSDDVQAKLMAILMKGLSATSSLIACPDFFIFRH